MFHVHDSFGTGLVESVHANSLAVDLRARGIEVERHVPFDVREVSDVDRWLCASRSKSA